MSDLNERLDRMATILGNGNDHMFNAWGETVADALVRIDGLEKALRIVKDYAAWNTTEPWAHVYNVARRALGDNDE